MHHWAESSGPLQHRAYGGVGDPCNARDGFILTNTKSQLSSPTSCFYEHYHLDDMNSEYQVAEFYA